MKKDDSCLEIGWSEIYKFTRTSKWWYIIQKPPTLSPERRVWKSVNGTREKFSLLVLFDAITGLLVGPITWPCSGRRLTKSRHRKSELVLRKEELTAHTRNPFHKNLLLLCGKAVKLDGNNQKSSAFDTTCRNSAILMIWFKCSNSRTCGIRLRFS